MVGKFHDSIREVTNAIKNTKSIIARESIRPNCVEYINILKMF